MKVRYVIATGLCLAFLSSCSHPRDHLVMAHRRSTVHKVFKPNQDVRSEKSTVLRKDLEKLKPEPNLDRVLHERLVLAYQEDMETYDIQDHKRRRRPDVFDVKPEKASGPVIFLKPVQKEKKP